MSVCVWLLGFSFCFFEVKTVRNNRESIVLFCICSILLQTKSIFWLIIEFHFLPVSVKIFFQTLNFINILNRFVWCSLAAPARVIMF